MPSAIVLFRPTGPWRFGPDSGVRDRVDLVYHSDSLYAAVTSAMLRLDFLDEWLGATARREDVDPDVRFSSLFPFQRDHLYVTPPRSLWPPPPSTKIRFKSARFVPLTVVQSLVAERPIDENRWIIDAESQCMIPSGEGPFRIGLRSAAAVDRLDPAAIGSHTTACIEFTRDAGLWMMVVFASDSAKERWHPRVKSALRLLADSGFGGERSRGWGRSQEPEWREFPELWSAPESERAYWLLSLYAPSESDAVDWKAGNYSTVTRTGRIESAANWGGLKRPSLMISEGSVLVAPSSPRGEAPNVAPPDFAHAVYRAGFAVTIPIPWRRVAQGSRPVQQPSEPVEPTAISPTPEPLVTAPELQPVVPIPEPEPGPDVATTEIEPATPVPPTEPKPLAATTEPEPAVGASQLEPVVPTPEPEPVAPTPEPQPVVPTRTRAGRTDTGTEPVVPTPEPRAGRADAGTDRSCRRRNRTSRADAGTRSRIVPTPKPEPVVPTPEPRHQSCRRRNPNQSCRRRNPNQSCRPLNPNRSCRRRNRSRSCRHRNRSRSCRRRNHSRCYRHPKPEPSCRRHREPCRPVVPTPKPEPVVPTPEPQPVVPRPEPASLPPNKKTEPVVPTPKPEPGADPGTRRPEPGRAGPEHVPKRPEGAGRADTARESVAPTRESTTPNQSLQ